LDLHLPPLEVCRYVFAPSWTKSWNKPCQLFELLARNLPGNWQDTKWQPSFDVCYVSESVRGLVVLLHGSRLLKSSFLPRGIENGQLLQYGHAYQLSVRGNVKTMYARARVLRNSAKTETLSPQNDRATKRNVNFLLAATIFWTHTSWCH
jgi:hypothetical protein